VKNKPSPNAAQTSASQPHPQTRVTRTSPHSSTHPCADLTFTLSHNPQHEPDTTDPRSHNHQRRLGLERLTPLCSGTRRSEAIAVELGQANRAAPRYLVLCWPDGLGNDSSSRGQQGNCLPLGNSSLGRRAGGIDSGSPLCIYLPQELLFSNTREGGITPNDGATEQRRGGRNKQIFT